MCLRNLFCGEANCSWLLFIIVILLLICNDDCGNNYGCERDCGYERGCGC